MKKLILILFITVFMLIIYVWQRSYTFRLMNKIQALQKEEEVWNRREVKIKVKYEKLFSPLNLLKMKERDIFYE